MKPETGQFAGWEFYFFGKQNNRNKFSQGEKKYKQHYQVFFCRFTLTAYPRKKIEPYLLKKSQLFCFKWKYLSHKFLLFYFFDK